MCNVMGTQQLGKQLTSFKANPADRLPSPVLGGHLREVARQRWQRQWLAEGSGDLGAPLEMVLAAAARCGLMDAKVRCGGRVRRQKQRMMMEKTMAMMTLTMLAAMATMMMMMMMMTLMIMFLINGLRINAF